MSFVEAGGLPTTLGSGSAHDSVRDSDSRSKARMMAVAVSAFRTRRGCSHLVGVFQFPNTLPTPFSARAEPSLHDFPILGIAIFGRRWYGEGAEL